MNVENRLPQDNNSLLTQLITVRDKIDAFESGIASAEQGAGDLNSKLVKTLLTVAFVLLLVAEGVQVCLASQK